MSFITDGIWDMMFEWVYHLIFRGISDLFEYIEQSSANIFDLSWIQSFIVLFHHLAWMLFGCGLVVAIFDLGVGYESGRANIKDTCLNILKGFMAAGLVTVVPQRLYVFSVSAQGSLMNGLSTQVGTSVISKAIFIVTLLAGSVSVMNLFFILLFGYCTIKVILANIKRGGILLTQIAVGSLYLFSVPRGMSDGFVNWCKQVIATCLTAFLQTTLLYLGLMTFTEHMLLALGICLSANEVPRIAQMFGLDTSVHVNMHSVSTAVSMGSKAIKLMAGK